MNHLCYYIRENDSIIGVIVLRIGEPPEHKIGIISELYIDTPDVNKYAYTIKQAAEKLSELGAAGIFIATAENKIENVIKNCGFLCIKKTALMVKFKENIINFALIFDSPLINKGDHDWDQYPNLRQPSLSQFVNLAIQSH